MATHEADHRYVITGYVRDSIGVPIPSANLVLEHKGGEKKKVKTNSEGYYEILFHLHNDSLGDQILVSYGETTRKHKVQFDVDDKFTHRGAQIDFGAPGKEGAAVWIYLTIGSVIFLGVVLLGTFRKKNKTMNERRPGQRKKVRKKR